MLIHPSENLPWVQACLQVYPRELLDSGLHDNHLAHLAAYRGSLQANLLHDFKCPQCGDNPWLSTVRLPKLGSGWSSSLATVMARGLVMPSLPPSAVSARRWGSGRQRMAAAKHATSCTQWQCTSKVSTRMAVIIGVLQNAMANGSSLTTKESPR